MKLKTSFSTLLFFMFVNAQGDITQSQNIEMAMRLCSTVSSLET